uniref:Uncharacterized protein n=1 Tax=Ditylenchus dipsaci TaxID=166011 RepID=A0A915DD65_9BILA
MFRCTHNADGTPIFEEVLSEISASSAISDTANTALDKGKQAASVVNEKSKGFAEIALDVGKDAAEAAKGIGKFTLEYGKDAAVVVGERAHEVGIAARDYGVNAGIAAKERLMTGKRSNE